MSSASSPSKYSIQLLASRRDLDHSFSLIAKLDSGDKPSTRWLIILDQRIEAFYCSLQVSCMVRAEAPSKSLMMENYL